MKSAYILSFLFITSFVFGKTNESVYGSNSQESKKISFTENKGQVSDQNYKPRPDILFSGTDDQLVFHLKNNGISYQLARVDSWQENPF